jgi:hypothetical protein
VDPPAPLVVAVALEPPSPELAVVDPPEPPVAPEVPPEPPAVDDVVPSSRVLASFEPQAARATAAAIRAIGLIRR